MPQNMNSKGIGYYATETMVTNERGRRLYNLIKCQSGTRTNKNPKEIKIVSFVGHSKNVVDSKLHGP